MQPHLHLICLTLLLFACNNRLDKNDITTIENQDDLEVEINNSQQLDLSFSANYTASIGWGDIYECKLNSASQKNFQDTILYLRVFPGQDDFISGLHNARFKHSKNDTTHRTFQGFIDSQNRNWELILFDDKAL